MVREEAEGTTAGRRGLRPGLALAVLIGSVAQAFAADPILERLAGNWTGRGTIQLNADAEPEKTFCRITNTLAEDGMVLQQSGRCAAASNSGALSGSIRALGSGRYEGSLQSPSTDGPSAITGEGSGNQLVFTASFVDSRTHRPGEATITLELLDGGYRLVANRRALGDKPAFIASEIVFTPN